jgi:glycerol-3-phosphate dehydrogenase (NAD(P)+)
MHARRHNGQLRCSRQRLKEDSLPIRVAVIGAGSWGTTVASLTSQNTPTLLWAREPDLVASINDDHTNPRYLAGFALPEELRATSDIEEAVRDADLVVMGVPSHGFRDVIHGAAPHVRPWVPVVSLAKGLEAGSLKRMTEIVHDELPGHPVAVLTGPNLAKEIMAGQPAASVVAIADDVIAVELRRIFSSPRLRIFTNPDVVGSELSGVVKNVIAIAAGMVEGMGFGDNTRATVITRGLAEMTRLGVALGGDPLTFGGLAGAGDLIATCLSRQSRNNMVGHALGQGRPIGDIVKEMRMVAEGVKSSRPVASLAEANGVEMPITRQVVAVCHEGRPAAGALQALMAREPRDELYGIRP